MFRRICIYVTYQCVWCMCHICVSYIWVCDMYVSLICVSCMWYMCHIYVCDICVPIPCVCECVFMCVHMYLDNVWLKVRGQLERDCCLFSIIWLRSSGLAEGFFPWSHQPLACLFFSLSVSMSWTSLYFAILFKMAVCGIWNYHNLNFFFLHLIPKMPMHCHLAIFFFLLWSKICDFERGILKMNLQIQLLIKSI